VKDLKFEKPTAVEEISVDGNKGRFQIKPLERGYGITLGNSLRRALLSSIEGSAVTSIKVEGAPHEYSTIPGVMESVSEIILNLKRLVLRSHSKVPKPIYIKVDKKGEVTAADIICDETVEILNPGLHIATLSRDASFSIEMEVSRGRGYVPAELNKKDATVGTIPIDSIFTPITRVKFDVENTRVGQKTDYDCLLIEIWTNGSIS